MNSTITTTYTQDFSNNNQTTGDTVHNLPTKNSKYAYTIVQRFCHEILSLRLPGKQTTVLHTLIKLCLKRGYATVSVRQLARMSGCGLSTANRAMKELSFTGLFEVIHRRAKKGGAMPEGFHIDNIYRPCIENFKIAVPEQWATWYRNNEWLQVSEGVKQAILILKSAKDKAHLKLTELFQKKKSNNNSRFYCNKSTKRPTKNARKKGNHWDYDSERSAERGRELDLEVKKDKERIKEMEANKASVETGRSFIQQMRGPRYCG